MVLSSIRSVFPMLIGVGLLTMQSAAAQMMSAGPQQYYHPLHQQVPPGQAAAWIGIARQDDFNVLQPLRIHLPSSGTAALYTQDAATIAVADASQLWAVQPGHVYRLRLADMPEFPGLEVFPSVELLDRLHPPAGREDEFPVPIPFSEDDIRLALAGHMVTRVIYLEEPKLAQQLDPLAREVPQMVAPGGNALEQADRLGRPIAIVRIGGRTPAGDRTPPSFFGTGGAAELRMPPEAVTESPQPVAAADSQAQLVTGFTRSSRN